MTSTGARELKKSRLIHLFLALTFFTSGLIINFIQSLLYFCLKTFNIQLSRYLINCLLLSLTSQLVFVAEFWTNSRIELWIDPDDKEYMGKEKAFLIMNHSYEIDWLAFFMFADKFKMLGNCKSYAKKSLSYLPGLGWAWKFAEFMFLERSYEKDEKIIKSQLKAIMSPSYPVWLILLAEGTRFTEKKHEASVKFAKEQGLPVLKYHLLPRTKGFTTTLPSIRNMSAIYDVNIAFKKDDPVTPKFSNLLNGNGVTVYMYIRRIPMNRVPDEQEKAAQWLRETFYEKDKIQDSFHTTGSFFKTSGFKETQSEVLQPRWHVFVNFVAWMIFTMSIFLYFVVLMMLSQNWIGLSITLGLLLGGMYFSIILMDKI